MQFNQTEIFGWNFINNSCIILKAVQLNLLQALQVSENPGFHYMILFHDQGRRSKIPSKAFLSETVCWLERHFYHTVLQTYIIYSDNSNSPLLLMSGDRKTFREFELMVMLMTGEYAKHNRRDMCYFAHTDLLMCFNQRMSLL